MAKAKKKKGDPVVYTAEQLEKIEEHIEKYYGEIDSYFHESETDDIQLNIYLIPATLEHRYITLVTSGLGAYRMNVPESIRHRKLDRCELVMTLPAGWNIHGDSLEDFWPLHLIKLISRLPITNNNWLGWGHTIDYGTPFAENTGFSSIMLVSPSSELDPCVCKFSDDDEVNFYHIIPLYESELDYKNTYGATAILDRFGKDYSKIVDIDRPAVVKEDFRNTVDRVEDHSCKIRDKELDIPEICGANHISAYFRWMLEHNMLCDDFLEFFAEEIEDIRNKKIDVRKFVINCLGGELNLDMFNDEGMAFTEYYYNFYSSDDDPCYPADVDSVALDFYGEEKYNCEEFGDEAYLFVPYDEKYYKSMCRYINRNYRKFLKKKEEELNEIPF